VILADSSVWIDYLRDAATWQVAELDRLLDVQLIVMGDLILTEVLQGSRDETQFRQRSAYLSRLPLVEIGGGPIAIEAARNYLKLRELGITVRKTVDTLIATRCIADGLPLLHKDRDFDPFAEHLGLRVVSPRLN
jgi:predicted nucleic acid-binding protein